MKEGSSWNRSVPLNCHVKSYLQIWSFIFADYPERNFDCTSTSKFSRKFQWNLSCRVFKINFRTCRFWNCHWFWNLMFISWRNLCLENVYLTCEHSNYTSVVPHRLICSVPRQSLFELVICWHFSQFFSLVACSKNWFRLGRITYRYWCY